MEQVIPKTPLKKAWPLMTPAERLAIWEDARLAWTQSVTPLPPTVFHSWAAPLHHCAV